SEREREDEAGDGEEDVRDPHDDLVDPSPVVAGDDPEHDTDKERAHHDHDRDKEVERGGEDDPAQVIPAQLVRAQQHVTPLEEQSDRKVVDLHGPLGEPGSGDMDYVNEKDAWADPRR